MSLTLTALLRAVTAVTLAGGWTAFSSLMPPGAALNAAIEDMESSAGAIGPNSRADVRTIHFSGYDWTVKSSTNRVGPGPNYFSDSADNVEVDGRGRLHLKISRREGRWTCAEIISKRSFGYGTYRFYLDASVDSLDSQVVLGMFTWSNDPAYKHREIDIEISRWGKANNKNGQFVVQPSTRPQNIVRYQIPTGLAGSTHIFTWKSESVSFQAIEGQLNTAPDSRSIIQQHTFTQNIPRAGDENARINFWLWAGKGPTDDKDVEVIISKFEFVAEIIHD